VLFERFAGEARDVPQLTPEKTVLESGPKRILLVEDSDSNRILIGQYIKNTFHELIMVENGQKAVEYYQNDSGLDIILMDVLMPVMDGLDATRLIREYEKENDLSPVPIIALTANAFEEDRQNCLKAGCTDYLSKPVRKADLLSRIDSAVRPTDRRG
jgi:CheY-like chemotaxis protein